MTYLRRSSMSSSASTARVSMTMAVSDMQPSYFFALKTA
jgi:hypothetical protein